MASRPSIVAAAVALGAALLPSTSSAAQPQFWALERPREFVEGETEGISVDSEGRLRLAPSSLNLHDAEMPFVWALEQDRKGGIYLGTGNDGQVLRIHDGESSVFFDAEELEIHALAFGPDGRLYVGTSPDGKVYAVDRDESEVFYDPPERYIWDLTFDNQKRLLVATGAEGNLHRVTPDGEGTVLFTSPETHLTTLVSGSDGTLWAGSSPSGYVYRIDPAGKVFVVYDSPFREIKALALGTRGDVYAAAIEAVREIAEAARPPATPPAASTPATGQVTVTEAFVLGPTGLQTPPTTPPSAARPPSSGPQKGAVLRIAPSGEVDTIWSSTDETPHALVAVEGGVLVGSGDKGKVYRVADDRTWTMIADFTGEQVTALWLADADILAATSNPGTLYRLSERAATEGTFVSGVRDTETVSSWGRLRWDATTPQGTTVEMFGRSGNTGAPDSTWGDWQSLGTDPLGRRIASEAARYLQLKAVLRGRDGRSPVLHGITAAYLPRNLRPMIESITVHPAGEAFQKPITATAQVQILGLEDSQQSDEKPPTSSTSPPRTMPAAVTFSRKIFRRGLQTFSWKGSDPNSDDLEYTVHYRRVGDDRYNLLRRGDEEEAVLAWDTSSVPNGRYVVRVTASDAPSNPSSLALQATRESDPFDVDNTAPVVTAEPMAGRKGGIRVVARDAASVVRRCEYSVDGGAWLEVYPVDGIGDSLEETFDISLPDVSGVRVVVVRALDLLGNTATTRIDVP